MMHYTHTYIKYPQHRVTIDLVGMGGTGSQVLSGLARINSALQGLGHPGLYVRAWDADIVTTANMGRQLFSPADVGVNKAIALVGRVNRFFGMDWEARPEMYKLNKLRTSNILITCVDTAKARLEIAEKLKTVKPATNEPTDTMYYWLDMGNLQSTGQCVLGTILPSSPPAKTTGKRSLKNVVQQFPQLKKIKEEKQGPSCSLAEALEKQDLFINSTLANFGCQLIWKLIREGVISYNGCYVNLETCIVNPIKIK